MAADFLYYLTNADFSQDYIEAGNCFTGAKDVRIEDPLVQEQFDNLIKADWTQNFYDQQKQILTEAKLRKLKFQEPSLTQSVPVLTLNNTCFSTLFSICNFFL